MLPAVLTLAALGLALADWRAARGFAGEHRETLALLEEPALEGLPSEVAERLSREVDPAWRNMLLARALVATELDLGRTPSLDPAPEARARRLAVARDAAAAALADHPTSWQGALFLGSATYLERSVIEDPLLFTAYRDWEAPLELARDLAPSKKEAGRFLTVAYLELWPAVSPAKRQVALELMTEAFRDRRLLGRLVEPWLEVAEDLQAAFAPIPDDPLAWRLVEDALRRRENWPGVVAARRHRRSAEASERRELLRRADHLLERGDGGGARRPLLSAATLGHPETAAVPTLVAALDRLPPGPAGSLEPRFRAWLDWALELCHRERCPLPPRVLERVAGLAGPLEPAVAAHADLVSGRLAQGEQRQRKAEHSRSTRRPEWAPYHVERARQLQERGETSTALASLEQVPTSARDAAYWWVREDLEATVEQPLERRRSQLDAAAWALAAYRGPRWHAVEWSAGPAAGGAGGQRRDLLITDRERPAPREELEIALAVVPEDGGVVEVRLDGALLLLTEVTPGRALRIPAPGPGLHRLELESVAGGRVLAGEVRRVPAVTGGPQAAPRSTAAANPLAG